MQQGLVVSYTDISGQYIGLIFTGRAVSSDCLNLKDVAKRLFQTPVTTNLCCISQKSDDLIYKVMEDGNHMFHIVPNSISDTESNILSCHHRKLVTRS